MLKAENLFYNSNGIILPPGAEIFDILVANFEFSYGYDSDILNSSIQPNIFMGTKIEYFYTSELFPGTWLRLQNPSQTVQYITVIRLDTELTLKLERGSFLNYYTDQFIFSNEDVGKTIKVALLAD